MSGTLPRFQFGLQAIACGIMVCAIHLAILRLSVPAFQISFTATLFVIGIVITRRYTTLSWLRILMFGVVVGTLAGFLVFGVASGVLFRALPNAQSGTLIPSGIAGIALYAIIGGVWSFAICAGTSIAIGIALGLRWFAATRPDRFYRSN